MIEEDSGISTLPVEEKVDITIEEQANEPTMPEQGVW